MSGLWMWLGLAAAALAAAVLASLWSAGRYAKLCRGMDSSVIPPGQGGALDDLLAPFEAAQAGASGVALVADPTNALARRRAMAQLASRSLDLLYYIWEDDLSGRLLARDLLAAADRGVRVRLLLDDVHVLNHDPVYRALDRHPGVQIRIFNPIRNRGRGVRRGVEILLSLMPYNRRMHGKLWLADGRLGMTGGRNIGDAYFNLLPAPAINYDDLDTMLAGPVLRQAEALFDAFWNSGLALPIRTLWPGQKTRLRRFRARLSQFLNSAESRRRIERLHLPPTEEAAQALELPALRWSRAVTFLGDPPQKALGLAPGGWMPVALRPLMAHAQRSVRILTPYFVPGAQGLRELIALARSGVRVEIVTNGLALADNVFVYGAYRWYRARLLSAGVRIFEVASDTYPRRMLHSKAILVDGQRGFVGSFNFDLRSAFLNTELGIVVEDPALIADLKRVFDTLTTPERAYSLGMNGRWPSWARGDGPITLLEPESTKLKRAVSFLVGHLPIHRFL